MTASLTTIRRACFPRPCLHNIESSSQISLEHTISGCYYVKKAHGRHKKLDLFSSVTQTVILSFFENVWIIMKALSITKNVRELQPWSYKPD